MKKIEFKNIDFRQVANNLSEDLYGVSIANAVKQGVCVKCRKPPIFFTAAGSREYTLSGMCEPCFDGIFDSLGEGF
jgi:hypothetical protein